MTTITVHKAKLLTKLRENKETHRAKFLKAQEGYRTEVIEQLDKALDDAKRGKAICTTFRLLAPQDQTGDYDTAIQMLEWEVGDEVRLEHSAFCEYVLDEWHWKNQWDSSNAFYMTKNA